MCALNTQRSAENTLRATPKPRVGTGAAAQAALALPLTPTPLPLGSPRAVPTPTTELGSARTQARGPDRAGPRSTDWSENGFWTCFSRKDIDQGYHCELGGGEPVKHKALTEFTESEVTKAGAKAQVTFERETTL